MTTAPSISTSAATPRATSAKAVVADAGLPAAIAALILDVAKRTRLWKRERAEVALELCAHFRDGLEAGLNEAELIRAFGDPAEAAALIRPARKRLRPLWWRAWRRTRRTAAGLLAICLLLYAIAAARFFLGAPSIKRNYMKELNTPTLATPVDQRGWPRYLDALHDFAPVPEALRAMDVPRRREDPGWAEYSAWIKSHPKGLQDIREGAGRPTLGYVLSSNLDPELAKIMEINPFYRHLPEPEVENPLMIGILLPHLGELRKMTRWMGVDAEDAAITLDRACFIADIEAMLGMADQSMAGPHLITQLVGVAIFDYARQTAQMHVTDAGLLTDDDLVRLSHAFIAGPRARVRMDTAGEAITVDDILQRFYTDDGHGGGRFVQSPEFTKVYKDFGVARPKGEVVFAALRPIQSEILPSRGALNALKDQFIARAAADEALPPWRHDERSADEINQRIGTSGLYRILPFMESLQRGPDSRPMASSFAARDMALARRDALLVIIALELHHRRHGTYPATLAELTRGLLPSVPLDPMNGLPLRYKPADGPTGTPLLYSVGADGIDDGGRPPATKGGRSTASGLGSFREYRHPREFSADVQKALDDGKGDWVIWPEPPAVQEH